MPGSTVPGGGVEGMGRDGERELMGENYWAYNIENNRTVLEAITQYGYEQGLSPERIDYNTFFAPDAAALPGV